ncbi:Fanconi anemia group C protein isoform X2 [Salarias fasciatus]|uniref:Fanconi anemia group C protein isoform X2 n=1 Tax=Salarias fasciatus TaxID=181472 RepID=UPI001176C080|nr:Fanconi anemia group C protein isoform X2 [Salarias fasciatus]
MSAVQPPGQLQHAAESVLDVQGMQFWLDKAVAWSQADGPDSQRDTCLHLSRLRDFLQQLLTHIHNMSSTAETMQRLPLLGQFLGYLCWNPFVTADGSSRGLLLQCVLGLHSEHPSSAVERKANQWIRKTLCQLATEEDEFAIQVFMKHVSVPPKEYHLQVLKKIVAQLQENIGKSCGSLSNVNRSCSCDVVLATSDACVPLVTYPEASPVVSALLQRPVTCVKETLSEDFLEALSSASASGSLSLEGPALVSLWRRSLSSLEGAVLDLMESSVAAGCTPQIREQQVARSLLPKACAVHFPIFLVVSDIFRFTLKQAERSESLKSLIQSFTRCFLRETSLLQPQMSVPLKAFFPQSPPSLLAPLLTLPSEMPREAWRNHLNWLSRSLQRLTEEGEEGDGDGDGGTRGRHAVFEAWFLLVQCAHWVQVAVQLLATSGPEDCGLLLWLLTFYHHPTDRWHHRAAQLVQAGEAWDHLLAVFVASPHPAPADRLRSLVALLSPRARNPPPLAPSLTISLLVNFAVFCQLPLSASAGILQTVVDQSGVADEAACVLSSLELRLNEGGCSSSDRVHLRIQGLQHTITHKHSA